MLDSFDFEQETRKNSLINFQRLFHVQTSSLRCSYLNIRFVVWRWEEKQKYLTWTDLKYNNNNNWREKEKWKAGIFKEKEKNVDAV